jgi:HAMP domain-containing protein
MSEQKSTSDATESLPPQMREFARVTTAMANGDLTQKVPLETPEGTPLQGEALQWALTINTWVDQMNQFAHDLTRLSREIGDEGKFGGMMEVPGVTGIWHDLMNNVNTMSGQLTIRLRANGHALRALAAGNSPAPVAQPMSGEMVEWRDAINSLLAKHVSQPAATHQPMPDEVFDTREINAELKGT